MLVFGDLFLKLLADFILLVVFHLFIAVFTSLSLLLIPLLVDFLIFSPLYVVFLILRAVVTIILLFFFFILFLVLFIGQFFLRKSLGDLLRSEGTQIVESIESVVIRRILGLHLQALEEVCDCLEVVKGILVKAQQMLADQVSAFSIRKEGLIVLLIVRKGCLIKDDIKYLVVALLNCKRCWGCVPKVLLIRVSTSLQKYLNNCWPAICGGIVKSCVARGVSPMLRTEIRGQKLIRKPAGNSLTL